MHTIPLPLIRMHHNWLTENDVEYSFWMQGSSNNNRKECQFDISQYLFVLPYQLLATLSGAFSFCLLFFGKGGMVYHELLVLLEPNKAALSVLI